jgi:hypothetical protein
VLYKKIKIKIIGCVWYFKRRNEGEGGSVPEAACNVKVSIT